VCEWQCERGGQQVFICHTVLTQFARLQASLFTANFKLADPCTFRILVKNTTVLLPAGDPLRARTFDTLDQLVLTYQRLDDALLQAGEWDSETRAQVAPLLSSTIELQTRLRDALIECIALPA
jgi:hypothetical protein